MLLYSTKKAICAIYRFSDAKFGFFDHFLGSKYFSAVFLMFRRPWEYFTSPKQIIILIDFSTVKIDTFLFLRMLGPFLRHF